MKTSFIQEHFFPESHIIGRAGVMAAVSARIPGIPLHAHSTIKMVASVDHPFTLFLADGSKHKCMGYITDSNLEYGVTNTQYSRQVIFAVHPTSYTGKALKNRLAGKSFELLYEPVPLPDNYGELPTPMLAEIALQFLDGITDGYLKDHSKSLEHATPMLSYIREHLDEKLVMKKICDEVNLSLHRARHLFSEAIGMPISQYILWERLCAVMRMVTEGSTFCDACIRMGFTDHPHFIRLHRNAIGLPASSFPTQGERRLLLV